MDYSKAQKFYKIPAPPVDKKPFESADEIQSNTREQVSNFGH
jgi:hypothetical protein